MADDEDVVAYCPACELAIPRENRHCVSARCLWVCCENHQHPIIVDPVTGRHID